MFLPTASLFMNHLLAAVEQGERALARPSSDGEPPALGNRAPMRRVSPTDVLQENFGLLGPFALSANSCDDPMRSNARYHDPPSGMVLRAASGSLVAY